MIPLLFIINGEDVPMVASLEETLSEARDEALRASKNTGRRLEEWEVRKETGELADLTHPIGELELRRHELLFVTLRVGAGGDTLQTYP